MITKIRTNIFPTKPELKKLRASSGKNGAPVAKLVRRAIDQYLLGSPVILRARSYLTVVVIGRFFWLMHF